MTKPLTDATRGVQAHRLYAALRIAGYLKEEGEVGRFADRLSAALYRHGFYALVLTDVELDDQPESISADTAFLGGDCDFER